MADFLCPGIELSIKYFGLYAQDTAGIGGFAPSLLALWPLFCFFYATVKVYLYRTS
jgi:hypothetical protein